MIILDRDSLVAVTNQQVQDGTFKQVNDVYIGQYTGPTIYANTSLMWNGVRWSMVLWPLSEEKTARTQLLLHEAFHSIQDEIDLPMNNAINDHLDQEAARVLIRLEWNALLSAITSDTQRAHHIGNALWYRQQRFKKFPTARKNEQELEMSEGLAEYTGAKLSGRSKDETIAYMRKRLDNIPQVFSLARSSAYYSGPLYGFILDSAMDVTNWRQKIISTKSFDELLNNTPRVAPNAQDEKSYQKQNIVSFEKKRASERRTKVAAYLKKIKQPGKLKIEFNDQPQMTFDPYGIIPISVSETLYTTCEIMAEWGKLTVNDGAILKRGSVLSSLIVSPVSKTADSSSVEHDWSLSLNPGWILQRNKESASIIKEKQK